jgi:L-threonylcarbamoyladenylate synthase
MNQIKEAVKVLKKGGIIAYPTETVYGIGCNVFDDEAVKKIFAVKGRSFDKPLSVAVADFKTIEELAHLSEEDKKLIKKVLPGPVTFLFPKKEIISDSVTMGSKLVGVRFPKNRKTLKIIKKAGFPIITTSANLSGEKNPVNWKEIKLKVDFIVKGKCKYKKPSTIINMTNREIVRAGVSAEKYKKLIFS